jgi:hypothetical protein
MGGVIGGRSILRPTRYSCFSCFISTSRVSAIRYIYKSYIFRKSAGSSMPLSLCLLFPSERGVYNYFVPSPLSFTTAANAFVTLRA